MLYIIVVLLIIILIVSIVSLTKNINESNITERLGKLELEVVKELSDFKNNLTVSTNNNFNKLNDKIDVKLNEINDRVNERLEQTFERSNKTFTSVLERLSRIDEAQKKIDSLTSDIVSLENVLTDKKTRGIFGEITLKHILENVFGENNKRIFALQYTLSNGTIADSVIFAPEPMGLLVIDSKFPLENYRNMVDKNNTNKNIFMRMFKKDMQKHIDDIANKYIIPNETSSSAIMFLPAEAIFAEVNAYHQDVIEYAYKKKVWIAGPTTLMSTLTTMQMILKDIERDKYAKEIRKELSLLSLEFGRYKSRWDKLARSIENVSKDVRDIHVTTNKITKRFDVINGVEIEEGVCEKG